MDTTPPDEIYGAEIVGFPKQSAGGTKRPAAAVVFNRNELSAILTVYGRMVAAGEWRDYALDFGSDEASFSVFRRSSEVPIARIVKVPRLAKRQGAFAIINGSGMVLKRGHDLERLLGYFSVKPRVVR